MVVRVSLALGALLAFPGLALAAAGPLEVPAWSVVPFAVLLLAIAVLPLAAARWWHSNANRALVAGLCAAPVVAYLFYLEYAAGLPGVAALLSVLLHYVQFIVLLWALYTIAGGLVVDLNVRATPWANALLMLTGAALANLIGTTGASMVLIRPFLRVNQDRRLKTHLPVFFIFTVSNMGGLLTPLGDPPLFLGFLHGVEFTWTLRLWPQWLVGNGLVLAAFLLWDTRAARREEVTAAVANGPAFRVRGLVNVLFLAGVLAAVVLQSADAAAAVGRFLPVGDVTLQFPYAEAAMVVMALLSLACTPRGLRRENQFTWGAIIEVAVLFAGIFITMIPALALLEAFGQPGANAAFRPTEPWQYFWLTGTLSAFLDNAPTYMAFAIMAAGQADLRDLMTGRPAILEAISCGAVFLGAMTYIGNGPNFMVKAIAEENGYPMPSFFGYLGYSVLVLGPVFVLVTLLFFRG